MTSSRDTQQPLAPWSYTKKPAVMPHTWGQNGTPPDPRILQEARQHRRDAEARGEDPYAQYRLMARAAPSGSGVERMYRWAEKKLKK
ncbi:hypothetical protein PG987_005089 [Apiospora arundinis]